MTAQRFTPSVADSRACALYRFWVRHPLTGKVVLGYVGETARMPFVRLMEHVLQQPWSDTIVRWEVDPRVYAGKAAVLAAEKSAIEAGRPLYNVEWNMGNPLRIKPWEAVAQRQAREPGWVAPPKRQVRVPRQRSASSAPAVREAPAPLVVWLRGVDWWRVVRWSPVGMLGGWVAVVGASGPVATWFDGLAYGVGVSAVVAGLRLPKRRRRRR
ncbi:hypothetical protein ABZ949_02190 [Micromonospora tulbaghiae]|uniref:hypothetical protein n=1 Tax=Micromonospora tulbaghiae TaxID=479978 RepID=UPI0033D28D8D